MRLPSFPVREIRFYAESLDLNGTIIKITDKIESETNLNDVHAMAAPTVNKSSSKKGSDQAKAEHLLNKNKFELGKFHVKAGLSKSNEKKLKTLGFV